MTSPAGSPPDFAPHSGPRSEHVVALVLNNCEERLQLVLGLLNGESAPELLSSRELCVPRRTVQFLLPAVAEMLAEQELAPGALRRIAVTRGPGSFTGVRLALSAAAGLAAASPQRTLQAGLDYLPLVAAAALELSERPVFALTYARRGQVYLQRFTQDQAQGPLKALKAEDAASEIQDTNEPAMLVGTGLHKNFEIFSPLADAGHTLLGPHLSAPSPDVLLLAASRAAYSTAPINPEYGRAADAEDNLDAIAAQRGIDPAEARRMLAQSRGEA